MNLLMLQFILYGICIIACTLIVVFSKSLLRSVVALGASSFFLALIFFLFQANIAAIFELSVGAGLMSVLMIIAISLVDSIRENRREVSNDPE